MSEDRPSWQGPPVINKFGLREPPRWTVQEDGRLEIRMPFPPGSFTNVYHYAVMTAEELDTFMRELQEARWAMPAEIDFDV